MCFACLVKKKNDIEGMPSVFCSESRLRQTMKTYFDLGLFGTTHQINLICSASSRK